MQITTDLLHAPAEIIRQLLLNEGQVDDPNTVGADQLPVGNWPAYKGVEPSTPDNCITITTTTGIDSGRTMVDGEVASHFGFQVRFRAGDDSIGFKKASQLRKFFQKNVWNDQVVIEGTTYLVPAVAGIGQVLELGRDRPSTGRYICTLNAVAAIRVETAPSPLLQDDFVGANGLSIAARPMTIGPGWTLDANGFVLNGSGRINPISTSGNFATSDAGRGDAESFLTVRIPSGSPASAVGLLARMDAGSLNGWMAWPDVTNGKFNVSQKTAGGFNTLNQVSMSLAFDTDYRIEWVLFNTSLVATLSLAGTTLATIPFTSSFGQNNTRFGVYSDTALQNLLSSFLVNP